MNHPEIAANALNAASVLLAGRNSAHTWWTGIAGCVTFGWVFFASKLYADTTLQIFFVVTSAIGWWNWRHGGGQRELSVTTTRPARLVVFGLAGCAVAGGYGLLLHRFTDAFAPFLDSVVLAFSVLGQFLLVARKVETWWCWLLVNTVAVPLFLSRGLTVTAVLYTAFWVNAVVSLRHWRRQIAEE